MNTKSYQEIEAMRDSLIVFGKKSEAYYLMLKPGEVEQEYNRMMEGDKKK